VKHHALGSVNKGENENENIKIYRSVNDRYAVDVYYICLCGRDLSKLSVETYFENF
jgi:hypothetical protein